MRLGLSSAAATDADIDALLASCARRGLAALELRDEDAHGVSDVESARAAAVLASDFGVAIAGIRVVTSADVDRAAALAEQLGAAVLVATGSLEDRVNDTRRLVARGVQALLEVNGPADGWLDALQGADTDVAWQIDQGVTDLAGDVQRVLRAMPGRLRYVRLLGGGPETAMEDGRGIGALMGQLALARCLQRPARSCDCTATVWRSRCARARALYLQRPRWQMQGIRRRNPAGFHSDGFVSPPMSSPAESPSVQYRS